MLPHSAGTPMTMIDTAKAWPTQRRGLLDIFQSTAKGSNMSRVIFRHEMRFIIAAILAAFVPGLHAEQVAPSHQNTLQPGQNIANYLQLQFDQPYTLQKLSDNTYWVSTNFYSSLFYVGKDGVLLFDPLGTRQAVQVLQAISDVTDLPVTALVYSHSHQDHIGGANVIKDAASKRNLELRIIATDKTANQLKRFTKTDVPPVTEVISSPAGEFKFENLIVQVTTPELFLHSLDSSLFYLPTERVINIVDVVEPDDLPFTKFGGVIDIKSYRDSMNELLAMEWDFLNGGHFNVGTKDTIRGFLAYLDDVEAAVDTALSQIKPFYEYVNPETSVVSWLVQRKADVTNDARKILEPKYGHFASFDDVVDSHISEVYQQRFHHNE